MTGLSAVAPFQTDSLPVTILTGFLGAGKTTLLNRILTGTHGQRIAVVINEFGALGIDTQLLSDRRGPVLELLNGCLCCAAENDLMRGLDLMVGGDQPIDAVIIETSGLADPWPIMQGLESWRFARGVRLSGVITLVDAENYDANLDRAEAAFHQMTAADLVVINKIDLVGVEIPELIAKAIANLNPAARMLTCRDANVPLEAVLGIAHQSAPVVAAEPHRHMERYESAVLRVESGLDPYRFDSWLSALPTDIIRMKGFLRFAGEDEALIFERVGSRPSVRPANNVKGPAGAEIVVIGRALERGTLQSGLEGCVA